MTCAPVLPQERPTARALEAFFDPVDAFLERHIPRLEQRLVRECDELSGGLGRLAGLGEVLARAVGTQGRGGRRWRPLLTLAAAEACGSAPPAALDVAVAVELTHTASLALDDLPCMDDAETRRGEPATHRLVGSAGAILLSVGLLARAVELLGASGRHGGTLTADWGRTVGLAGMAGGQAMDVAAPAPMRGAERRLHRTKSSALPAFALAAGARTAGAEDAACRGLASFGRGLGWAYQLLDDGEDLAEDAQLGRATSAGQARPLGARIMRLALRRLERLPNLSDQGRLVLEGLAGRVVPLASAEALRDGTRERS